MRNLFISEILLLSQKEKRAKRVRFDRKRTLIHGKNHTGKSSLIKSIYWAFGAEPLFAPKFKDANVSSLVKFEVDDVNYQILRDGKQFAIFDSKGEIINNFTSVTKELGPFLGKLLDFTPLFQSIKSGFIIPPPAFLFLPYYVDQDISWTKSWSSFSSLQQIKEYRNQSIYYHSGIRPNEYYATKQELQDYLLIFEEAEKEQKITNKILLDINEKLTQTSFNIDIDAFKEEIEELLTEAKSLKQKEERHKSSLYDLHHLKTTFELQIEIVKHAILESNKDLKFTTENLPDVVGCPTCGAEYENSFAERFEIAKDERKSKDLLLDLNRDLKEIQIRLKRKIAVFQIP